MGENLLAIAGYLGSITGPGRFHMPQSNEAHLLRPRSGVCAQQLEKPLQ